MKALSYRGRKITVVFDKKYKQPEFDATQFESYHISRLGSVRFGLVVALVFVLSTIAVFVISVIVGKDFGQYAKAAIVPQFGKTLTIVLILITIAVSFIITLIIHEAIHVLALPRDIEKRSGVVVHVRLLIVSVYFQELHSKRREIFISLAPVIFMSLFFVALLLLISGPLPRFILLLCLIENIFASDIDICRAVMIAIKAPKNAGICQGNILVPKADID